MGNFIFRYLMRKINPKGSENIWMGRMGHRLDTIRDLRLTLLLVQAIKKLRSANLAVLLLLISLLPAIGQLSTNMQAWIRRIKSGEFDGDTNQVMGDWVDGGAGYARVEPGTNGSELVRYDSATGARKILLTMTAAQLTPPGFKVRSLWTRAATPSMANTFFSPPSRAPP